MPLRAYPQVRWVKPEFRTGDEGSWGMADALASNAFVPISDADDAAFRRDGHVRVRGALAGPLLARVEAAADELYARTAEAGDLRADASMRAPAGALGGEVLAELLDLPAVFPHVWGHLGWNIVVDHGHVKVGSPGAPGRLRSERRDAGPLLALTVGYVLSGRDAGDALVADRRLWPAHDEFPIGWKAVVLGYAYRWSAVLDGTTAGAYQEGMSPLRRQLLGHDETGSLTGTPYDEIPLRAELKRRGLLGGR